MEIVQKYKGITRVSHMIWKKRLIGPKKRFKKMSEYKD